ncbi:hypothetical protein [Streptomyces sp. NPDC055912]|uniref:hypothetical protein n=1 Tax=unclassified Streptomyces TaxID=2593676 RepID=UPI0035DCA4D4
MQLRAPGAAPVSRREAHASQQAYQALEKGNTDPATADGPRRVVILARRAFTRPPGVGWVALLLEATGWTGLDRCGVDWAAAEAGLGTALPGDYTTANVAS